MKLKSMNPLSKGFLRACCEVNGGLKVLMDAFFEDRGSLFAF